MSSFENKLCGVVIRCDILIEFAEDGLIERTSDDKSIRISCRLCKRAGETIATSRTLAVRGEIFVNKCDFADENGC